MFVFGQASWVAIRKCFRDCRWDDAFADLNAYGMAKVFEEIILRTLLELVSTKTISNMASSNPWLNDRCRAAIDKFDAFGTDEEVIARDQCSKILLEEHDNCLD